MAVGLLLISPPFHSIRRSLDLLRQQHRLILDSAGEGIFGLDLEGKVTFVNPAAASLSGYRIEELLRQNIHNMIHYAKADGSPHQVEDCPIHATLKNGEIHRVAQDVFWKKDGMSFSVEYTSTPTIEKNRIIGTTVVFKDITERKEMEEKLRQSEEHYRGLITNGTDMVSVLHVDGSIQYLSPPVERMLGYTPEELIGTNAFDLIHSEDVKNIRKLFEEVVQVEESVRVGEYRIRRKDGSWRFHESIGKNLLSHATISGIVVNSRDITESKQAEETLARLASFPQLNPDPILELDSSSGRITFCNPAAIQALEKLEVSEGPQAFLPPDMDQILKTPEEENVSRFYREVQIKDAVFGENIEFVPQYKVTRIRAFDITEHKQAEDALRETNETLQAMLQASPVAINLIDTRGNLRVWNRAAEEMFGWKAEEVLGRPLPHIPPGKEDEFRIMRDRALQGVPYIGAEVQRRRKDGSLIDVSMSTAPLHNAQGDVMGAVGILMDISQRKQAEKELSESESRYRHLVELSPDTIFIQTEGKIAYINPAGVKLFGATRPEELLGLAVLGLAHPDFKEIIAERIRHLRDGKTSVPRLEEKYLRLDGSVVDIEVAATSIVCQGKPGALVMVRDITERKRSLREIESQAKLIGENPNPVLRIARDGTILYANPSSSPLLKLWGREIGQLLPDDLRQLITESLTVNLRKDLELECGGSTYSLVLTPITDPGYLNIYGADISERKRAEEELRQSEEQLRQSQKMEAIGGLAGGVAHDFNNILMVILNYGELLRMKLKDQAPLLCYVEEMQTAADRAASLTRQLLAFSRKQVLQPQPLDLNEVVAKMDTLLRRIIGEDLDLKTILGADLGTVNADQAQLEQVIMNLAVNSRDAMPQGGKLTIETANVELDENYVQSHVEVEPGQYVMLAMSDTGIGLDKETQERIFEPFFTTKEQGTGLGLSMVYGIVKQSGGNIYVYSELGHGTTFKIYLPKVIHAGYSAQQSSIDRAEKPGSGTILLLEDEEAVRRVTRKMLEISGYTVLEASNGREAIDISEKHQGHIDLLLTDIVMPEISGLQAAESLVPHRPEMKVLFMSGHTENAIVHHGILDPEIAFIQKPFRLSDLLRKVQEVLDS